MVVEEAQIPHKEGSPASAAGFYTRPPLEDSSITRSWKHFSEIREPAIGVDFIFLFFFCPTSDDPRIAHIAEQGLKGRSGFLQN